MTTPARDTDLMVQFPFLSRLFDPVPSGSTLRRFAPGDILLREDDQKPGMLVLTSGSVRVSRRVHGGQSLDVGVLGAPNIVGELSLFTGESRTATITAVTEVEAYEADARDLLRLSETDPQALEAYAQEMARRLVRSRLQRLVRAALGISVAETLTQVVQRMDLRVLEPGQVLYEKYGDADTVAVLLEGRLEVRDPERAHELLGLIFPGESVGEQGLLGQNQQRTARVRALRRATLAVLSRADFESLLLPHVDVVLSLIRRILERTQNRHHLPSRHGTVAFVVPEVHLFEPLRSALNSSTPPTAVGNREVFDHFRTRAVLNLALGHPLQALLGAWVGTLEAQNPALVLYGDARSEGWNAVTRQHSDLVIEVLPSSQDPSRQFRLKTRGGGTLRGLPRLPGVWDAHDEDSTQRIARLLQRRGRGLVLSGGGARGFAHLGVLQALVERGLPPDSVGGTSMGALVGSLWALHRDMDVLRSIAKEFGNSTKILDWTLPSASLVRSRKLGRILRGLFGDTTFADLTVPFFCISTDLRAATEVVFDEGRLYDAVRSSISIPGIFFPVVRGSSLLVDGGVMNNYPLGVMADRLGGGILMGSNVGLMSTHGGRKLYRAPQDHLSGWQRVLLSKFRPKSGEVPAIADILMRTFDVNTARRQNEVGTPVDLAFEIDVSRFDPLDFGKHKVIMEEGYRQATAVLEQRSR